MSKLYYRKFTMHDLPALYNISKDKNTTSRVGNRQPWTRDRTKKFIIWNMQHDDDDYYGIFKSDTDTLIGVVGTNIYKFQKNALYGKRTITIFLSETGKGYGSKALSYIIELHPDEDLYASIDFDNEASLKLFKKMNFIELYVINLPNYGNTHIFIHSRSIGSILVDPK